MARNEQGTYASYARDEFDNPPAGPVGAHRGKTSLPSRLLPYLVVLLVAILAGAIAWGVYSGEASNIRMPWSSRATSTTATASKSAASASATKSAASGAASSSSDAASSSASASTQSSSPSTSAPTTQAVNKATAVVVTNATTITGHAAQKASLLTQSGYTSVTSRNASGQIPASSVVMYQNETDKATAQDVANTLGVGVVEQVSGISGPIVVVLVQ